MKLEITEQGVFASSGKKGAQETEVAVGTTINVKGDAVPASLIGKCRIVGKPASVAAPVTNLSENDEKERVSILAQLVERSISHEPQASLDELKDLLSSAMGT